MEFFDMAVGGFIFVAVTVGALFFLADVWVDWSERSGLLLIGVAVLLVLLVTVYPHGWSYLHGHPIYGAGNSRLTSDEYFELAKYRFWAGIVGCAVGFCVGRYLKSQRY